MLILHHEKSALLILQAVYRAICAFGDQAKWQDEVTVVVIKKLAV